MASDIDNRVRLAAFDFLKSLQDIHGGLLPREKLAKGFVFEDQRVPLVGPQGIFKPKILADIPLSITTSPNSPYDDSRDYSGNIRYRYRGRDVEHRENVGLRTAMTRQIPLIYFIGVDIGTYYAAWPAYIVGDDPAHLTFTVAIDKPQQIFSAQEQLASPETDARRRYCTVEIQQRVHQQGFRHRVLKAYRETCAICSLRHQELLEAAHILPDGHPHGDPIVPNGIALCNIHHAAYDSRLIGIRPDYVVEIRKEVLEETDGPMLKHGLQGFNNTRLILPKHRAEYPKPEFLAERYQQFLAS